MTRIFTLVVLCTVAHLVSAECPPKKKLTFRATIEVYTPPGATTPSYWANPIGADLAPIPIPPTRLIDLPTVLQTSISTSTVFKKGVYLHGNTGGLVNGGQYEIEGYPYYAVTGSFSVTNATPLSQYPLYVIDRETVPAQYSSPYSQINFISGIWTKASGGYDSYHYQGKPDGNGNAEVMWEQKNLPSGLYKVSATWYQNSTYAPTKASYRIEGNGIVLEPVMVNQRLSPMGDTLPYGGARPFQLLGTFHLPTDGSKLTVRLSRTVGYENSAANGFLVADAIRVERVHASGPFVVDNDLDNGGIRYRETGAGWTDVVGGFGGMYSKAPGNGGNSVTWEMDHLAPGSYEVRATWAGAVTTLSEGAPFSIYDGDSPTPLRTVFVNQEKAPTGTPTAAAIDKISNTLFQTLGVFPINSGKIRVVLSDTVTTEADGNAVVADAIAVGRVRPASIVDDYSDYGGSYWQEGAWTPYFSTSAFNQRYSKAAAGSSAYYQFNNLEPSLYLVQATWVTGGTSVPITVYDGDRNSDVYQIYYVNQSVLPAGNIVINTRNFQTLGIFYIESGSATVRISAIGATGSVIADAVRLEPISPSEQIFIDWPQADYFETSGWSSVTDATAFGGNYRRTSKGTGQKKAGWTIDYLPAARYEVKISYVPNTSNVSVVSYIYYDGSNEYDMTGANGMNQASFWSNAGQTGYINNTKYWYSLGSVAVTPESLFFQVSISDKPGTPWLPTYTGTYIEADAIRIHCEPPP